MSENEQTVARKKTFRAVPWWLVSAVVIIWGTFILVLPASRDTDWWYSLVQALPLLFLTTWGAIWYHNTVREKLDEMHDHMHFTYRDLLNEFRKELKRFETQHATEEEKLRREMSQLTAKSVDAVKSVSSKLFVVLGDFDKRYDREREQWETMLNDDIESRRTNAEALQNIIDDFFAKEGAKVEALRTGLHKELSELLESLIPRSVASELDYYFDWQR